MFKVTTSIASTLYPVVKMTRKGLWLSARYFVRSLNTITKYISFQPCAILWEKPICWKRLSSQHGQVSWYKHAMNYFKWQRSQLLQGLPLEESRLRCASDHCQKTTLNYHIYSFIIFLSYLLPGPFFTQRSTLQDGGPPPRWCPLSLWKLF